MKRNAIAAHRFESLAALEGHLAWWMREIADVRRHGTTGETPRARFEREADRLSACAGTPPFGQLRDLIRTVHADCAVTVDNNAYLAMRRYVERGYRGFDPEALVIGDAAAVVDQLHAYADLGFTDILVRNITGDQRQALATIERLARVRVALT